MVTLAKELRHPVGQAMDHYQMLAEGDRVLVAVSGGIDSLVLAWLLDHWRAKAPIAYELLPVHLDMGFPGEGAQLVAAQLARLGLPATIERTNYGLQAQERPGAKSICFTCARKRRNRLFVLAEELKCNKIAFGHHKDDIIETFFLNLLYSGKLSTMRPRQDIFGGKMAIIRPLAYLLKEQIVKLGVQLQIEPVTNPCPMSDKSKRTAVRQLLDSLYQGPNDFRSSIFNALGNVKSDYLLGRINGTKGRSNRD